MKGSSVTAAQKRYWTELCHRVGCIVCRLHYNTVRHDVCIHHIDGRTKPHAHWYVLPLRAGHHQDGTGDPVLVGCGRHATGAKGGKAVFETLYGFEDVLFVNCLGVLKREGVDVPMQARQLAANFYEDAGVVPASSSFVEWLHLCQ